MAALEDWNLGGGPQGRGPARAAELGAHGPPGLIGFHRTGRISKNIKNRRNPNFHQSRREKLGTENGKMNPMKMFESEELMANRGFRYIYRRV